MVRELKYEYELIPCEVVDKKIRVSVVMGTHIVTGPIAEVYGNLETKQPEKVTYKIGAWVPVEESEAKKK